MNKKFSKIIRFIIILAIITIGVFAYVFSLEENKEEDKKLELNPVIPELIKIEVPGLGDVTDINYYQPDLKERYITYKNNNPDLELETIITYVNIGIDQAFYTNAIKAENPNNSLVLVNKYHQLSSDFVPANLKTIDKNYSLGNQRLQEEAQVAFEKLAKAAREDNHKVRAVSTYRSFEYQKNLYNNYVKAHGITATDTFSARAGHSEHQTGLAVDVDDASSKYTSFRNTQAFLWMKDNAHKYGFNLRYPENKTAITGFAYEAWHYRYLGTQVASYLYENDLTFDEYMARKTK